MTLWEIFRFEVAYQARRAWPWLIFVALLAMNVLMTRDASLSDALFEDIALNAPFTIAKTMVFGTLFWLLAAASIAGEAAARDVATRMHALVYTTPISKTEYLAGRFLAAFVVNVVLLLSVPLGILFALRLPGMPPEVIAPFRLASYLSAFALIAVPNAFVATALQFALALRSGRAMAGYLGSMILVFMGFFVASLLLFSRGAGTLLDPIGIRFVVEDIAHLWTTVEKNTRLLGAEGVVLQNRLLWTAIGTAVLMFAWLRFRFEHRVEMGLPWRRTRVAAASPAGVARASTPVTDRIALTTPSVAREFGATLGARQLVAVSVASFLSIAKSWGGVALLVVVPLLTIPVVLDQMVSSGSPLTPTTGQVLQELTGPLTSELSRWVIVPLLLVFFAGELVWRERESRVSEIADATPVADWIPTVGALAGLALVTAAFLALLMIAGMIAQAIMGYDRFEPGLYAAILFGIQLPEYLLFAALALCVHTLVDHKYIGHLATVAIYVLILLAPLFGIEHSLLIYGSGPWWSYTEMRGLGPFIAPWFWFRFYWAGWAALLVVAAVLFRTRGRNDGFRARVRLARHRLSGGTRGAAAVAAGVAALAGGYVFYNTNVLNAYVSPSRLAARSAEYERRYGRFANVPQPRMSRASLRVEIRTEARAAEVRGRYTLVNRSEAPIDSLHVATSPATSTSQIGFDRPATRVLLDEALGHRIYRLAAPLRPGDSVTMTFSSEIRARGFRESGADLAIVANGSSFTGAWLPAVGYDRGRELVTPSERRAHRLGARPVIPSLYDTVARRVAVGGTQFDAVVGTSAEQIAVAPGALRREWQENGRRYFHYVSDGAIGGEWAFASARYAVHEARWRDVVIRILHHPSHTAHVARAVRGIRSSLEYFTAQYGPYRYRHITLAELPGDGVGVHADASMLTHGEGYALLKPASDSAALDFPFAVMAHEMAHQWTVPYAPVEGAPVMSESLAWFQALLLVAHIGGEEQLERLLAFMRRPYPIAPIRRGEPLLRGLDPYMSYRRGPFALYTLSRYTSTDRVNGAIRNLLEAHRVPGATAATTLDLYRELESAMPDSLRYLLHDLFVVNTFYSLETERVVARPHTGGGWEVTLHYRAAKTVVDSAGVETSVPMAELVEVAAFAAGDDGEASRQPVYRRMHRVVGGVGTIRFVVPKEPRLAGLDPYHLLDLEQREGELNVKRVKVERAEHP